LCISLDMARWREFLHSHILKQPLRRSRHADGVCRDDSKFLEYRMVIRTTELDDQRRLSETLAELDAVKAFQIAPTGD
jgi:hypothetical protein